MLLLPQFETKYKAKTSLKSMGNVPQGYLGKSLPIRFNKKGSVFRLLGKLGLCYYFYRACQISKEKLLA
jgi:hypothetical protein